MKPLTKLLVANRGEIACRIFRTARAMGLRTVAVYSDADASALHVGSADEAVRIGPPSAVDSYLSIIALLDAARRTGADAVHPGYGFLSENADFADACSQAGIVFVGPPADAIRKLGNKARAKELAEKAGVRCIGGYRGEQDDATLVAQARRIGFPILIKAAAGGGGRGMRRVDADADLPIALAGARTEAQNAFGSGELILERLVENARHVEVQYVADTFGNDVTLGERDCSAQRRHQKVIEEAPCPVMTDSLRSAMSDAAKAVARAAGYVNAGTLEFLLDAQNNFYFLEMNTRLQVEHPVTELVTGLDLVELQLRIARGEQLPIAQQDVKLVGHAIEARVYAEDPAEGFRPQTGVILHWRPPTAPSVRVDHGLQDGSTITPYYDPMVAKVMTVGRDRDDARNRLLAALRDTTLLGVHVNLAYLEGILAHPVFAQGAMTTAFLSTADAPPIAHESADALTLAVAAAAWIEHAADSVPPADRGWRSTGPARSLMKLRHRESEHHLSITYRRQQYQVAVGELTYELAGVCLVGDVLRWSQGGLDQQARVLMDDRLLYLQRGTNVFCIEDVTYAPPIDASSSTSGSIKSPMSGRVLSVAAIPGSTVKRGDILVVVEAMKMENHVVAARDGVVEGVHVAAGDQVDANQLLVTLSEVLSENSGAKQEK